jgi:hypothetical protein
VVPPVPQLGAADAVEDAHQVRVAAAGLPDERGVLGAEQPGAVFGGDAAGPSGLRDAVPGGRPVATGGLRADGGKIVRRHGAGDAGSRDSSGG